MKQYILDVYSISIYLFFISNSDNEEASGTAKKRTLQKFIFSATLTLPKSFKRKGKEKKISKGEALGTVYVNFTQGRLLYCFLENICFTITERIFVRTHRRRSTFGLGGG